MPSAQSAIVSALAVAVALYEGLDSVAFGITAVFAFIVICDAAGLRRSVGRQAHMLDRIFRELQDRNAIAEGNRDSSRY
jgi:acid phosphatase family membrane protein YuiD